MSGTCKTIGSFDKSKNEEEYKVSAFGLATSVKLGSGNVGVFENWLYGAAHSLACLTFVVFFAVISVRISE